MIRITKARLFSVLLVSFSIYACSAFAQEARSSLDDSDQAELSAIDNHFDIDWENSGENILVVSQAENLNTIQWERFETDEGPTYDLTTATDDASTVLSNVVLDFSNPYHIRWVGTVSGQTVEGSLFFLENPTEEGNVVVSFEGGFSLQFEMDPMGLSEVGIRLGAPRGPEVAGDRHLIAAAGVCKCVGNSALTCTEKQCNEAEDCPGGNGKPKCKWMACVVAFQD